MCSKWRLKYRLWGKYNVAGVNGALLAAWNCLIYTLVGGLDVVAEEINVGARMFCAHEAEYFGAFSPGNIYQSGDREK